jgi:transposase
MMRFYQRPHAFYCGIDLHARTMYLCVLDSQGAIVLHQNLPADPKRFLNAVAPYRSDLVVCCECLFAWYWLGDLCRAEKIPFVLGHALYMKAIHGGKTKNDKIDAEKIARLLRGGNLPMAYPYPQGQRETRDLMRRRGYLVHKRAALVTHIQITNAQYNLPPFEKKLIYARNRVEMKVAERFTNPHVSKSIAADVAVIDCLDEVIGELELYLEHAVKVEDSSTYHLLRTIPGVGKILALTLLYEIHEIRRFETVGDFISYARLVRPAHESAGKKTGSGPKKIGNAHLRWAFGEAVCLLLRESDQGKRFVARKEQKHGKAKAMGLLAAKLGRAVYWMLRKETAFDEKKFWSR